MKTCYKCEMRTINCHSTCKTYKKYKDDLAEKKAFQEIERQFGDYIYYASKRMKGLYISGR